MGGFNLPPGVTTSMLPGNEPVGLCEVCGGDPDALIGAPNGCICPECSECGAFGDPECHEKYGLVRTAGQIANRKQLDVEIEAEAQREERNSRVQCADCWQWVKRDESHTCKQQMRRNQRQARKQQ